MKLRVPRTLLLVVALGAVCVSAAPALAATSFTVTSGGGTYTATPDTGTAITDVKVKVVVEKAVTALKPAGGTINFAAGTFDLGTDSFVLGNFHDIVFAGAGMGLTTIMNSSAALADTEPFNMRNADRVTIRDLTVSAGGPPRSTSDAIDSDGGNDSVVLRVKITASRARGIIFDGKDVVGTLTRSADRNVIKDCVITGTAADGIELLASSHNTIQGCTITDVGGPGIQLDKASTPTASQPNKKSTDNIITGNTITNAGGDGIYINSGDRNQITNNIITNSSNVTIRRDGIRIGSFDSITCDDNVVSGNTATDNQTPKTQKYGLNIASFLCNRTVVGLGNKLTGNLTGPIHDLGTGTIYLTGTNATPPPPGTAVTPFVPSGVSNVKSDIYSVKVNGTGLRRVTNAPVGIGYDNPAWSRNGRRIAFSGPTCAVCPGAIFLIRPDGGMLQQLPGTVAGALRPSWGRLDRSLTFVGGSTSSVYTINRLGSGQRRLTLGSIAHDQSVFSPDGRQIAFTTQQSNGRWDIFVMRSDGSHKRNLTRTVFSEVQPAWSHDGHKIAFARQFRGKPAIFVMTVGVARPRTTLIAQNCQQPAWSPGDRQIACTRFKGAKSRIIIMRANGTRQHPLVTGTATARAATWSPNGRRIAFSSTG